MKLPGPDHPITIERNASRVRVTFGGTVVADTPSTHSTHCPYKGDASYFSIAAGGRTADNAVWSYEQPFPAMAEIKDHLAFYPHRVDKIEEGGA
jgi:uncharacterized protein (DUF427 family)